jgi:hypothetical protein
MERKFPLIESVTSRFRLSWQFLSRSNPSLLSGSIKGLSALTHLSII